MLIGIDGNEANTTERVGSNVYSFELLHAIEAIDQNNEYTIYLKEKKQRNLPQERKLFRYRILKPSFLWTRWRLPLYLYLHQPRPEVFFTPGHYAPRFSPVPTVITILDLSFLNYPESFQPAVLSQLTNWTKQSALHAAHILTISEATKKDIIENYHISSNKITVTYPGVSRMFLKSVSLGAINELKKKYNISGKYLLFVGTRQSKKNLPRLLEAFTSINRLIDESITLVIAGKNWQQFTEEEIDSQANSKVTEVGYVPEEELPALMKGAEALVLPSLYEGFGIPVAEAMAVGTPVVASRVSSLPEVVGPAGILVNPLEISDIARGMNEVLSLTDDKRVQLIKAGKHQAEKFDWRHCAQKTLDVLKDVASA